MYEHYLIFIVIDIMRRRLETTKARLFPYREGVLLDIGQPMLQGVPKKVGGEAPTREASLLSST